MRCLSYEVGSFKSVSLVGKLLELLTYFFSFIYLFIYLFGCIGSSLQHVGSFVAALVAALVVVCGLLSNCGVQLFSSLVVARAPECVGSVVCGRWVLSLRRVSSVVVARGLSCPVACGILVPQPGIKPTSPALEGGFFTTGSPGKSLLTYFFTSHKKEVILEDMNCVHFISVSSSPTSVVPSNRYALSITATI